MKNLDLLSAQISQEIIKNTKGAAAAAVTNLITKTLGVLQENGVYAAMLYLYSCTNETDKSIAKQTRIKLLALTSELGLGSPQTGDSSDVLPFLTKNICNNLDELLLTKQVWEQTLIYARYGAKARSATEEEQKQ